MKTFLKTYWVSLLGGILLALSYPSWGLFPLAWIAMVPLVARASAATPWTAFRLFWLASYIFYTLQLHWLTCNCMWGGGWALIGYQVLCMFMALYWGLLGALWVWTRKRGAAFLGGALFLALGWGCKEYLEATLFTGFGWGSVAYSQGPNLNVLQWASVGGAPMVSALIILFNALLGLAWAERSGRWLRLPGAIVVILAVHIGGGMMLKPAEYASTPYNVGTFQSNYSVEMKWDSEYEEEMVRNAAEKTKMLVERGKLDLMIWPECLLMREIEDPDMLSHVEAASKALGAPLFTGSERYEKKSGRSMNSSWLVDGQGKPVDYYDKVHLAPFGEFVPLSEMFPFIGKVVPAIGDVGSGTEQKVFTAGSRKLGPMICFEVLFTSVAETLRKQGADFLVVITNLAWFGHSAILPQELDIARIRAIETRLPLVHCANTGISGMFDPYGRFSLARIGFDGAGRMGEYSANIPPEALIMRRCMGAFTLPLPAPHLTPGGSWWFPRVAGLATLAMAALSLVIRRKQTPEGGDDAPRKA